MRIPEQFSEPDAGPPIFVFKRDPREGDKQRDCALLKNGRDFTRKRQADAGTGVCYFPPPNCSVFCARSEGTQEPSATDHLRAMEAAVSRHRRDTVLAT